MVQRKLSLNKPIKKKNSKNRTRFFFKKKNKIISNKNDKFKIRDFPEIKKKNKILFGGMRYRGYFKNSISNYPLISIIMPNYKEKNLSKAIKSILDQKYENLELIIIDGDSGPDTVKILKNNNNNIDLWISEKDKGLWDAWNKGFKLARGDYVGIVDSSNLLYNKSMNVLRKYININKQIDFVCGTVKKGSKIYAGFRPQDIHKQLNIIPSSVVGFYIKMNSLKKVGLLNLSYKIQSDYDLIYRMIVTHKLKGIRTKGTEIFGSLGDSGFSTKHGYFKSLFNELKIRFDNNQSLVLLIYIFIGRTFMKFFRFFLKT